MTIGKREQIVVISIGALLFLGIVHFLIFDPRSKAYVSVFNEFNTGMATLNGAAMPASPDQIPKFKRETAKLETEVSSTVEELKLNVPQFYKMRVAGKEQRWAETSRLLAELVALKSTVQTPKLRFLDDIRDNPTNPYAFQNGWNFPAELPKMDNTGALWDTVVKLSDRWVLMNSIANPAEKLSQRVAYNDFLGRIGLNPAEVSNFVMPLQLRTGPTYVFFNDGSLLQTANSNASTNFNNVLSINRFGVLLPVLKRLWISDLIWAKRDPSTQITKERLREILEISFPSDADHYNTNKQLESLIDIIKMAEQNQILEFSRVNLMKPVSVYKKPPPPAAGATPTPAPVAKGTFGDDMDAMQGRGGMAGMPGMMGMPAQPVGERIGDGTGVEVWFTAPNANMVKFLFDVTHAPRTYAVDDMNIRAIPNANGVLSTSATIELVTKLDSL
ncbi:MAG: hypothetical protein K1X53_16915 [Candidatus Sumerlaeaceae bacterium]|nr:hypothetical protein [Candidatus Sumerlaeaceae bacterium]